MVKHGINFHNAWLKLNFYLLIIILSTIMALSGLVKLIGLEVFFLQFSEYGFKTWSFYLLGFIEILSAIFLWLNSFRNIGVIIILIILIGGVFINIKFGNENLFYIPLNILLIIVSILILGFKKKTL